MGTSIEQIKTRKLRRLIFNSGSCVLLFLFTAGIIYGLRPILLPFILGAFLAYLCKPLVTFRGSTVKKYIRSAGVVLTIICAVYFVGRLVKESLPSVKQKLVLQVRLRYRCNERYENWMGLQNGGKGNLIYKALGQDLDPMMAKLSDMLKFSDEERHLFLRYAEGFKGEKPIDEKYIQYYLANNKAQKLEEHKHNAQLSAATGAHEQLDQLQDQNQKAANGAANLAGLLHVLTTWLIFPLTFIFILLDKGQIMHFFMRLVPNRYFELVFSVVENVDAALGKYIRGTLIECLLVGLTLMIGFAICGIEFKIAVMIGLIGGLTNAIPFVGTFMACIVGAAYALIAENVHSVLPFINSNNLMLAVLCVVLVTHILDNAVYQPMVVGHAVDIHPLVVIIGVFGGSMMFGFAGLIFAIPTIVVTKVVIETFYSGLKEYKII